MRSKKRFQMRKNKKKWKIVINSQKKKKSGFVDINTISDILLTVKDLDDEHKICHLRESSKLNSKSLKNLSKELSKEVADMMDITNEAEYEYDYGTGVTQKVSSVQGVDMNYEGMQVMSIRMLTNITLEK